MSEHLTKKQIEGYGRRTLSASELLFASDHLKVCDACRLQVERSLDSGEAFLALKSQVFGETAEARFAPVGRTHLTIEQTADYVDGTLAGEELQSVKDHLTSCKWCDITVNDLRGFRDQVAPKLDREYRLTAVRAAPENRRRPIATVMSSLLPRPFRLVLGSALTALLVISSGWLVWRALQTNDRKKPEITQKTPSPATPPLTPDVSPTSRPEVAGEMLLAQLNDGGGRIILDREGNLSGVERLPPPYQRMVKRSLADQWLEKSPLLAGLTRPGNLVVRSGEDRGGKFSVIEPVGKVILSDHPTFRWSRLDGATSYVVEIYDDKLALVATSPRLTDLSWTAAQSLQYGAIYSWQVKTIKDGREFVTPRAPAPQATFRILDQAKANELVQARRAYASSHLALGLLYAQAGLIDEAERELRALQKANPNSAIVSRLLANVRALRN
ncbi:MAG TPA: zf-HC2 domain-containing protein [Blastocatellia bacterium]|nr:zf-HC2 domain-containing protein [Blastocatellia bacterium]